MIHLLKAGLEGLAALPKLIEAVERIGDRWNDKQVKERLSDKRNRNRAAIDGVLESATGHGRGVNNAPAVSGSSDSSAGVDTPGLGPDSGT